MAMTSTGSWLSFGAAIGIAAQLSGATPHWPAAGDGDAVAGPVAARVLGVLDGDTLLVRARIWLGQEVETLVRVAGVDAPEMRSACAAERALAERARDFVVRLVGEREVQLRDVRYDKYGRRVVARVEAGGTDVAAALVAAGLGRPYAGKSRGAWCDPADGR